MRKNAKIIHPIFLECVDFTLDFFWQQILNDLAYGKYPKGTGITNNILYVKNKGITETIALSKDPKETFLIVTNAFREKLGLSSSFDKKKRRAEIEKTRKSGEMYVEKWSLIKKKAVRECLLHRYVCTLVEKHKLPAKSGATTYNLIDVAFNFGAINSDDVKLKNGKIISIRGVKYDKKKNEITVNYIPKESKGELDSKKETNKKVNLSIVWKKYVDAILKKNALFLEKK